MSEATEQVIFEEEKNEGEKKENEILEKYPEIALSIETYLHRVRDCQFCANVFIPLAKRLKKRSFQKILSDIKIAEETFMREHERSEELAAINLMGVSIRKTERIKKSNIEETLLRSLFLKLFSSYEAFTGDLLTAIYNKKPELYSKINREIKLSDLLNYNSFDEVKSYILQEEIEVFRRKSYVEQFEILERDFSINLKKFDRWKDFVECSQRRNLLTHCDGVVSEQYIKICKEAGCCHGDNVNAGDRLSLDNEYFFSSCKLMMEVSVKLGHTLWRKLFPDEIEKSDSLLGNTVFEFLQEEDYDMSEIFGEFASTLPNVSKDINYKVSLINYTISLKFGNKPKKAKSVLAKVDWSAASNDFKIAEAVLSDQFDYASTIMEKIGKRSDLVHEQAYHDWPLFKEFRKSEIFKETYEKIYGHSFIAELERAADKAEEEIREEVKVNF